MKQAVLSLSGGMDSTSLLLHLLANNCQVTAISFKYGQKHSVELTRAARNLEYLESKGFKVQHHIVDLSSIMSTFHSALTNPDISVPKGHYEEDNMKATVVPNRNAIFLSIIYGKALSLVAKTANEVFISLGIHAGDHAIYPDCRPEFRDAIFRAFTVGNWESEKVLMYTPYLQLNKADILIDAERSCERLNLDFDTIFANTNTCYSPDEFTRSCGKCGSCVERIEAFIKIQRADPVVYSEPWKQVASDVIDLIQTRNNN